MAIAKTLYEKIVESHTVKRIDNETVLLYVDAHFANEYTSPQAFSGVRQRGCGVLAPESHLCVVDHIIFFHVTQLAGIIVRAANVIAVPALRHGIAGDTPDGEQRRLIKYFNVLEFLCSCVYSH